MLVTSDVGRTKLLPALPAAWPTGRIEGVLCRGAVEIQSLKWDGKQVTVKLRSAKPRSILLELPSEVAQLSVTDGAAAATTATRPNQHTIALSGGQPVTIHVRLE